MIAGRDSSYSKPTGMALLGAINAGVKVWGGYLATKPDVGIAAPWDQSDFDNARQVGSTPIAYCSGWDDPVAVKALATQWNVRACLDVEAGIRPDGVWKSAWLASSGAGLYGNPDVHNVPAAFHIMAWYPGTDPGRTWIGNHPPDNSPLGWQWQGTHSEFGISVDSLWLDDSMGDFKMQLDPNDPIVQLLVGAPGSQVNIAGFINDVHNGMSTLVSSGGPALVPAIKAEIDAIKAEIEAGGSVDATAAIARVEAALKAAGSSLGGA